jgi:hypothetical protein
MHRKPLLQYYERTPQVSTAQSSLVVTMYCNDEASLFNLFGKSQYYWLTEILQAVKKTLTLEMWMAKER